MSDAELISTAIERVRELYALEPEHGDPERQLTRLVGKVAWELPTDTVTRNRVLMALRAEFGLSGDREIEGHSE